MGDEMCKTASSVDSKNEQHGRSSDQNNVQLRFTVHRGRLVSCTTLPLPRFVTKSSCRPTISPQSQDEIMRMLCRSVSRTCILYDICRPCLFAGRGVNQELPSSIVWSFQVALSTMIVENFFFETAIEHFLRNTNRCFKFIVC